MSYIGPPQPPGPPGPYQPYPPLQAYPGPQPYPGPYWQYPPPTTKPRKGPWLTIVVLLVVAAGAGAGWWFFLHTKPLTEEDKVRAAVNAFAKAADEENIKEVVALLCTEEASQITNSDNYDPNDTVSVPPANRQPVNITDVRIDGDTATTTVTRPPDGPHSYHLTKEDGQWKLCNPGPVLPDK